MAVLRDTTIVGSMTISGKLFATSKAVATADSYGLIKVGYSENGRNFPVELNSDGKAFVNVPTQDLSGYVLKSGDTITGNLGVNGTISEGGRALSLKYLSLSGGTMTGDIRFQFTETGTGSTFNPGTFTGLSWDGSSDSCRIYFDMTVADTGKLTVALGDDTNTEFQVLQNTTNIFRATGSGIYEVGEKLSDKYAPKSHSHLNIASRGNVTAETGTSDISVSGLSMSQCYNNGYPTNYGNILNLRGSGMTQLLLGWSGASGAREKMYYRSQRDTSDANWSAWDTVASEQWVKDLTSAESTGSTTNSTSVRCPVIIVNNKMYVDVPVSISGSSTAITVAIGSRSITISQSSDSAALSVDGDLTI